MKWFCLRTMLLIFAIICLGGCASTESVTDSDLKTGGPVPGEKTGDEQMGATAGPGSAAAGVRW